jgi:MYXO-CTERM domain-containing protein
MPRRTMPLITGLALSLGALSAEAHVHITSHPTRYGASSIKSGPCGLSGGERTNNVNFFRPGETITLEWDEYIFHPGYFRISFDDNGDDFVDPVDYFDFNTDPETVLLDDLFDGHVRADGPFFTQDVTLPNIECDNCTLQLIQMMTDKPPYVVGTNDIYYNCLDVVLTNGEIPEPVVDFAGGGGCAVGDTSGASPLALLALGLSLGLLFRRRGRKD